MTHVFKFSRAAALCITIFSTPALAFCPVMNEDPWAAEDLPIKVFLNSGTADALCNGQTCPSLEELRFTTDVVLDVFHDTAGSNLYFDFAGFTDLAPGTIINKAIHIYGGDCGGSTLALTSWASGGDGRITRANMRFCALNDGGRIAWDSYSAQGDGTRSFQSVLSHELMHAIGFDHPDQWCGQNFKSVVRQFYARDQHHLYPDDIDGLQAQYGIRTRRLAHVERSFDGLNWAPSGPPLPTEAEGSLSRFGACNSVTAGGWGRTVAVDDDRNVLQFYGGGRSEWAWLSDGFGVLGISEYFADIACRDNRDSMAFWLCGTSLTFGNSAICRAESTDAGATWDNLNIVASGVNRTNSIGVGAAYDPESDRYIAVWRNTNDEIVSKVIDPDADATRYRSAPNRLDFLRASDSVSISCAPARTAGPQNCLVAWSGTGWFRTLRWAHARVDMTPNGPRLTLGDIRNMGYVIYGTPALAFSDQRDFPWHLAFHQGGRTVFTLRKSVAPDAAWQNERQFSVGSRVVNPILGTVVFHGDDVGDISESGVVHTFVTSTP